MQFRKKPVVVEAMQWNGDNGAEMLRWAGNSFTAVDTEDAGDNPEITADLFVNANGVHIGIVTGEWVIKDALGFYPCKPDIFAATYEPVELPRD